MDSLSHKLRHHFRLVAGCALLVFGAALAVHAVKASVAQSVYMRVKYGYFRGTSREVPALGVGDTRRAANLANKCAALYPHNWYFPVRVAQFAVAAAQGAESLDEFSAMSKLALYFSNEAYCMNPYDTEARRARSDALALDDRISDALDVWKDAIAREYWVRENHTRYAELLLRAGGEDNLKAAVAERALVDDPQLRQRLNKLVFLTR